jgi:ribose transport system permease protein
MAAEISPLSPVSQTPTRRYKSPLRVDPFALIPYILLIVLVGLIFAQNPRLMSWRFVEIKSNAAFTLILVTVGQSLVILSGGIDLSVGGVIALTNSLAATQMTNDTGSIVAWTIIIILIGFAAGLINGFIVSVMRVTPFIATLATWSIFNGLALLVLEDPGGSVPAMLKDFVRGSQGGIPNPIVFTLIIVVAWLLFRRSRWGIRLYAVGSHEAHAYFNGTKLTQVRMTAYVGAGVFAALAGLYRTIEIGKGSPIAGDPFILQSVAAALVGGIALSGGRGNLVSAIVGAFIMLFINDLIQFSGVSSFYTPMIQGILLIIAVFVNSLGYRMKLRRALAQ